MIIMARFLGSERPPLIASFTGILKRPGFSKTTRSWYFLTFLLDITVNGDNLITVINMDLGNYLEKTDYSVYRLAKESGVPYTTLSSICRGKVDLEECRIGTLKKIASALKVSPLSIIDGTLSLPIRHRFINDAVELDVSSLPVMLRNSIKELEGYDEANDPLFFDAADTMLLMADRFLAEGVIDQKTYDLLARKYPIA
ncbi:MAG: helix-turn-helix domain-containing protein [Bacilli bacterium]|nr:helix-turn-helix domain-containing protein [Bacilli bacterium]MCH4210604.1 helix-turn-helix domain-containing protein [Bacilli bacterium]MCH4228319.1 helix-turn-helix domain-containing protein [Bacilli bacterium]MCH4277865.1 helix-turn-helix domain-containing protein [Bacilli bacterium]MCI2055109.1 helix-turn-helix domain-containing protein [Bacilli bacterium]